MPNITRSIPNDSEWARNIKQELRMRIRAWQSRVSRKQEQWREAEEKVLAFVPETEVTLRRKELKRQGLPDYVTIQIPYSYAVVMAAHTYITSVFLGRSPIFQYTGRHGEAQHKTQALEALIDYQVLNGYVLPYFYTWLYDALKYGYGIVCDYWEDRIEMVTELVEIQEQDPFGMSTGKKQKIQIPQPVRTYSGNRIFNTQPMDFIWDVRYPVRDFQRGEFAGRRLKIGWNEIVRKEKMGYYMNVDRIAKTYGTRDYYNDERGSEQLDRPELFSSLSELDPSVSGFRVDHPQVVGAYEIVVEIIPNEWKLASTDWPEKWVFTITDDFSTLIGVSPLGAMHCQYPYAIIPMEPEGYGLTTRGLPEILDPIQGVLDWLINSHFYNVRAALNNKFVVDPSRIVMKDVLNPLPGGIIRLKPEAWGQDTRLVMTQMQVTDVTQQHIANIPMMINFGERVGGVNDQIMGMLDTGGRKTATEVRTSTSFGINRLKTLAEFASAVGVDPLSRMFVQNTQQYYDMDLEFKIAGDLLQTSGPLGLQGNQMLSMALQQMQGGMGGPQAGRNGFVRVTPDSISGFYDFVPVDGTLPIDRFAQVNLWKELFQGILAIPQIGMQYDLAGIFQWVAQLAGLKNITQFRIQVAPDQMLAAQAQMGNSIPLNGPKAGGASAPAKSDTRQGYQQAIAGSMGAAM